MIAEAFTQIFPFNPHLLSQPVYFLLVIIFRGELIVGDMTIIFRQVLIALFDILYLSSQTSDHFVFFFYYVLQIYQFGLLRFPKDPFF